MINQYKISVITASYNSVKTIEQTIQSVVGQTYENIEYIIIDGGSIDGTVDIVKKYEDKIAYWVSEPDKGIYDAFNKGVQVATGDYIQFLGSDDYFCEETTIEKIVQQLGDEVDILSTCAWEVDGIMCIQHYLSNAHASDKKQFSGKMIPHPGLFVRREVLEQYAFDTSYRIAADYLFFLSCYYDSKIRFKYIDLPTVFFSMDGVSSSGVTAMMEENKKIRRIFDLPEDMCPNKYMERFKKVLRKAKIFPVIRAFYNYWVRRTWEKHRCRWNFCRWCHRL